MSNQVIYLETVDSRYELYRDNMQAGLEAEPTYSLAKVKNPMELDNEFYNKNETQIPLDNTYKEVIFKALDWHDFIWAN